MADTNADVKRVETGDPVTVTIKEKQNAYENASPYRIVHKYAGGTRIYWTSDTGDRTQSGSVTIVKTTGPQLDVQYDGSNHLDLTIAANGKATFASNDTDMFLFRPDLTSGVQVLDDVPFYFGDEGSPDAQIQWVSADDELVCDVGIGTNTFAPFQFRFSTDTTSAVDDSLQIEVSSIGTSAVGFGTTILTRLESTNGTVYDFSKVTTKIATGGATPSATYEIAVVSSGSMTTVAQFGGGVSQIWAYTAATATALNVLKIEAYTTGTAAAGFGPEILFQFTGSGAANKPIAKIQAIRGSADTEGDLVFRCGTNGDDAFMQIHQTGKVSIGNTTSETSQLNVEALIDNNIAHFIAKSSTNATITLAADSIAWTFSNLQSSANELEIASSSGNADVHIKSGNASNGDAILTLVADDGDNNSDFWRFIHVGSDNDLQIQTKTSGSFITKWQLATDGTLTISGTVIMSSLSGVDSRTVVAAADGTLSAP
jgi:hypothetical protein